MGMPNNPAGVVIGSPFNRSDAMPLLRLLLNKPKYPCKDSPPDWEGPLTVRLSLGVIYTRVFAISKKSAADLLTSKFQNSLELRDLSPSS